MTTKAQGSCPSCNKPSSGNFCQHCGATLGGRFCNQCGGKVGAKATFCNQCGHEVGAGAGGGRGGGGGGGGARGGGGGGARGGGGGGGGASGRKASTPAATAGSNLPWWIAGVAMFGVIFVVGVQMVRPAGPAIPAGGSGSVPSNPAAGMGTTDISQMTPIDAADRLFNRVMQSVANGDSAAAQQFVPMAISAYDMARPLSLDGIFHLSMLNRTAFNVEAALANALEILEQNPNHLLGLSSAAQAAMDLGRLDEASGYYQSIVDVYDAQVVQAVPEYDMHSGIVGTLKDEAEAFLANH